MADVTVDLGALPPGAGKLLMPCCASGRPKARPGQPIEALLAERPSGAAWTSRPCWASGFSVSLFGARERVRGVFRFLFPPSVTPSHPPWV